MSWFIFIWALCNLGFIGLATSMSKHQKQIFGKELNDKQTKLASIVGWLLLIAGLVACIIHGDSISNMISYWIGVLSFSALMVGLTLSYFAHKVKLLAMVSMILSGLALVIHLL